MKGARALASGMLVLAAICAVPAISAAQDTGMPARHGYDDPATQTADSPPDDGSPPPPQPGGARDRAID